MKRGRIAYSTSELLWISDNSLRPRKLAHADFVARWNRPDVSLSNFSALCKRKGWTTGRDGRFAKGQEPANKGKKMPFNANSARTQFQKGNRYGLAKDLWKPIGTERVSSDGYLERKIHDGLPLQSRWRAVHLIRWEEVHGPLPEGHALKCLDGDRANTDPSNWKNVPRSMLPRLSGRWSVPYDAAPAELKPAIMATAELEEAARQARKRSARKAD